MIDNALKKDLEYEEAAAENVRDKEIRRWEGGYPLVQDCWI
jgi:hypothetical protein